MDYNRETFLSDLIDPLVPHAKDRDRFKAFYEELGNDPEQLKQGYKAENMAFVVPFGKIIELGCHWGFNCIYYAFHGFECVGVEISESLLKKGYDILKRVPDDVASRVTFYNEWIEQFHPLEKYDTIILTEILEHVIDPDIIIKKAKECMKDDALIYISTPNKKVGTNSHLRGFTFGEMVTLLRKNDLEICKYFADVDTSENNGNIMVVARLLNQ